MITPAEIDQGSNELPDLMFWRSLTEYSGLHFVLPAIGEQGGSKAVFTYDPSKNSLRMMQWGEGHVLNNDGKIVSVVDFQKSNLLIALLGTDQGCGIDKLQFSVWKSGDSSSDPSWTALYNIKSDEFVPSVGMPELVPSSIHGHCAAIAKMAPQNFGVDPL